MRSNVDVDLEVVLFTEKLRNACARVRAKARARQKDRLAVVALHEGWSTDLHGKPMERDATANGLGVWCDGGPKRSETFRTTESQHAALLP